MRKITLLLLVLLGFFSVNAQQNSIMLRESGSAYNQIVGSVEQHSNQLRNINGTIFLDEDFNAGGIPAGWTVIDNDGGGFKWGVVNDYQGNALDGTPFAFVDSDAAGNIATLDTELVTPSLNTSGVPHLALSFDHYFNTYQGHDKADVDVYDGTNWVNVYSTNADVGTWNGPVHQLVDVTAYANSDFKVRFHYYNANYEYYWAVDNVQVFEVDPNDLAVIKAVPETAIPNIPFNLSATVYNNGLDQQDTFDVTFKVKDATNTVLFTETVNVSGAALAQDHTHTVDATNQPALAEGTYTLEVAVSLASDTNHTNDSYSADIHVINFSNTYELDKVYSYDTADVDKSGDDDDSLVTFNINDGTTSIVNHLPLARYLITGTFINDVLVVIEFETNAVYFVDGTTGKAYKYGYLKGDIVGSHVSAIAYDSALQKVYVTNGTELFSVSSDLKTTKIGPMNNGGFMVGMDFDNNGNLYGMDSADDNLYSIDPTTGEATILGPLGIDLTYAQDMGADPTTGNLYAVLFNYNADTQASIGGLYSINKMTGAATAVGTPGKDEYTVCAIFGTAVSVSENTIEGLKVYPNPTNGNILINAKEDIQNVKVLNLAGQEVMSVPNNGLNAQLNLSDLPSGAYILKIATDQTVATYQVIKK